jgi:hypothetical protein
VVVAKAVVVTVEAATVAAETVAAAMGEAVKVVEARAG